MEEEDEELAEQEESSRLDEVEEMVRDMVLVFFCTLWTLSRTDQSRDRLSPLRSRAFFFLSVVCLCLSDLLCHVSAAPEGSDRRTFTFYE